MHKIFYHDDIFNNLEGNTIRSRILELVRENKVIQINGLSSKDRYAIYRQMSYPLAFDKKFSGESINLVIYNQQLKSLSESDSEYDDDRYEDEDKDKHNDEEDELDYDEQDDPDDADDPDYNDENDNQCESEDECSYTDDSSYRSSDNRKKMKILNEIYDLNDKQCNKLLMIENNVNRLFTKMNILILMNVITFYFCYYDAMY